jgi:hypothetical protein
MKTETVIEQIETMTDSLLMLRDSGKISKKLMNDVIGMLITSFNMGANWAGSDPNDEQRMDFTFRFMAARDNG